jgi:hypothetical protein
LTQLRLNFHAKKSHLGLVSELFFIDPVIPN